MADFKIIHDKKNCIGCTACELAAPENWIMEEEGVGLKSKPKKTLLSKDEFQINMEAAEACPVQVIHIEDIKEKKEVDLMDFGIALEEIVAEASPEAVKKEILRSKAWVAHQKQHPGAELVQKEGWKQEEQEERPKIREEQSFTPSHAQTSHQAEWVCNCGVAMNPPKVESLGSYKIGGEDKKEERSYSASSSASSSSSSSSGGEYGKAPSGSATYGAAPKGPSSLYGGN